MSLITIRDIPPETHDELASRAARSGRSLEEYLRAALIELAQRPDPDLLMARIRDRKRAPRSMVPAQEILEHRNADRL